jgi:hypothetical protein
MTNQITITVSKRVLVESLNKNLGTHQAIFEEALEGYRLKAIATLEENLRAVKAGKGVRVQVYMELPESHKKDYERILRMLEMDQNDTVVLTEDQFRQYVEDDFSWQHQFLNETAQYSQTAYIRNSI